MGHVRSHILCHGKIDVMGAAKKDPAQQGQLLLKALAEHILFAKKTGQVERRGKN